MLTTVLCPQPCCASMPNVKLINKAYSVCHYLHFAKDKVRKGILFCLPLYFARLFLSLTEVRFYSIFFLLSLQMPNVSLAWSRV